MKKLCTSTVLLLSLLLLTLLWVTPVAAEAPAPLLSHGVQVLASQTDVALWAPVGNGVLFSEEAFLRGLNRRRADTLTLCSLPSPGDGVLSMGDTPVVAGQRISTQEIAHLVFTPREEGAMETCFTFTLGDDPLRLVCRMYLLDAPNHAPTLGTVPVLSLENFTYRNRPATGQISAYDPDGDSSLFQVVSYPLHGSLDMDPATGAYVYMPENGYTGADSFTYVARDRYGNYSASAEVSIRVALSGTSVVYADMEDSYACNAALSLTEAGIMSGTQLGSLHYFYPEKSVNRLEFLVMAMHAAGITDLPDCADTGFFDDGDIPEDLKGHVATAYAMKYISGSIKEGKLCFLPNEAITRAEATVILSRIVGVEDVAITPTFSDGSDIPVWARESVYSLHAIGILTAEGGYVSAKDILDREQAALLLWRTGEYLK